MSSQGQNGLNLEGLWYYFDSIERDQLDMGQLDRKSSQVQALKGKLLRLPSAEFDAAIKTIEKLVQTAANPEEKKSDQQKRKSASLELFEKTAAAGDSKASVDSISRVT
jgi:hypothetical protein